MTQATVSKLCGLLTVDSLPTPTVDVGEGDGFQFLPPYVCLCVFSTRYLENRCS